MAGTVVLYSFYFTVCISLTFGSPSTDWPCCPVSILFCHPTLGHYGFWSSFPLPFWVSWVPPFISSPLRCFWLATCSLCSFLVTVFFPPLSWRWLPLSQMFSPFFYSFFLLESSDCLWAQQAHVWSVLVLRFPGTYPVSGGPFSLGLQFFTLDGLLFFHVQHLSLSRPLPLVGHCPTFILSCQPVFLFCLPSLWRNQFLQALHLIP